MTASHTSAGPELIAAMGAVARELLGEPTSKTAKEIRFGSRGSVCIRLDTGVWHDHEAGCGGGVVDFVMQQKHFDKERAVEWLREHGHLPKRSSAKAEKKIVATYDYCDESSGLLFQVCRFEPKDFRQRAPAGNGGWRWKMEGVRRVPFRLPEVIAAIKAGQPIYIAEGEKAVLALAKIGVVATCSPGGASKWRAEYSRHFTGADVVILPDADEPGRQHAVSVAKALSGIAASVRILPLPGLPAKGDVADWVEDGNSATQMAELTAEAETYKASTEKLEALTGFALNEDGVALAFTEAHKDQLRYCHHSQHWFVWNGKIWQREQTKLAFSWARAICRNLAKTLDEDDKLKHILARASAAAAVERYAQADRAFAVTADTWDRDPWLLGTPAGTVNLKTGELRAPSPADYITKKTSVVPASKGTDHPIWTKFLQEATCGDKKLQDFLQRLAGYFLTGEVNEEVLAFLYGDGGSGKGTFIGTIVAVMGDYAVSVPIEVFTAGSRLNLEYYRAQMAGARLVTASETEAGATWAESQIKEMTGNETPLSARHPYGKPFTFRPQFKIGLVGNHAPRLKSKSKAMERRLRITPFRNKPSAPDLTLKERLREEYPAILRWMIDGCLIWKDEKLTTCPAVAKQTDAYFEQQDAFGRWMAEQCILHGDLSERPSKLLAAFLIWAKDSGESGVTSGEFRELIERTKGLRYKKLDGIQWVQGIGIKPPPRPKAAEPGDSNDDIPFGEEPWQAEV